MLSSLQSFNYYYLITLMKTGTIKFFNDSKGFGFITDTASDKEYFVHITALNGQEVKEGDEVTFEVQETPRGLNAVNVNLV